MTVSVYYVAEAEDEDDDAPVGSISIVKSGYVVGTEADVQAWAEDEFGNYDMEQKQFYEVTDGVSTIYVASNDLQDATAHAVKEYNLDVESVDAVSEIDESKVDLVEFDRKFSLTHGLTKLA